MMRIHRILMSCKIFKMERELSLLRILRILRMNGLERAGNRVRKLRQAVCLSKQP